MLVALIPVFTDESKRGGLEPGISQETERAMGTPYGHLQLMKMAERESLFQQPNVDYQFLFIFADKRGQVIHFVRARIPEMTVEYDALRSVIPSVICFGVVKAHGRIEIRLSISTVF